MMAIIEPVAATNFSFLRGASHPAELVLTAKALGLDAIGIADRNSVAGVVRAHAAAKEAGLRLIVGARLVSRDGLEAVIYPGTRDAWGRLTRILTAGNRRTIKARCDLGVEDLAAAAEDAVAILMPPPVLNPDWEDQARAFAEAITRGFIAVTRPYDGTDGRRMARLRDLARTLRLAPLATQDALYHAPERRPLADVVACIREKTTVETAGFLLAANAERHLKGPVELTRLFADWPEALGAHAEVLARARFSLAELRYEYPDEVASPGETPMETLRRLAEAGARGRYPDGIPASVRTALDHEYALIEQLDYAKYFLTVHDIVSFARARGILCQGRGSAANSVVCYCLGVTAVDPVKVDLLFERFVSPERREPPDIDVDFEHERREEVIQHIYEKYGRHRAGIAGTVICYRGRSAIREVAKALGLSADVQDALARTTWGWSEGGPRDAHVRDELGLDPDAPRLRLALDMAQALSGFPRHLSQHVGGFVITRGPLEEVVPIGNAAMPDRTFVEWDKDDLDALGILKIDVLALGMLTCVARAFAFLKKHKGLDMGLADVPPEDPAVYDMICRADTVGVFQIESRAQMSMLPRLRPRTFYDLVIEVAIVRPGPIQGDMVHPYLRRRQGLEPVRFPSRELEAVLGKTLGVPLFQEQAMRIAIVAAGFTPAEADRLRRAMATFRKVGIIHEFGLRLVEGMVRNGYDRAFAERCFKQIEGFGEYGFPESHAASFALIVYVSAWLKKHHPDVFLAAILNAQPMGFYAAAQLVRDAREHGVEVRPVDANASDWDCTLEDGDGPMKAVRLGLRQIKGFPEVDAARLVAARAAGAFTDLDDLHRRAGLSARGLTLLADADALNGLGAGRRDGLWQARGLAAPPLPLFAAVSAHGPEPAPALPAMGLAAEVAHDYARVRLSLKAHPLRFWRAEHAAAGRLTAADLVTARNGRRLEIAGLVLLRQRPGSAKGVIFMTLEDETGAANIIVWPKAFERFRRTVLTAKMLIVNGRLQREGLVIHVIADSLTDLTHRLADLAADAGPAIDPLARADEGRSPRRDPRQDVADWQHATAIRQRPDFPGSRDFH